MWFLTKMVCVSVVQNYRPYSAVSKVIIAKYSVNWKWVILAGICCLFDRLFYASIEIFNVIHMLVCWFAGTNDSLNKCPMFKLLYFFHDQLVITLIFWNIYRIAVHKQLQGSPTYTKINNSVPTLCRFGGKRKWGIFMLEGDLLLSQ